MTGSSTSSVSTQGPNTSRLPSSHGHKNRYSRSNSVSSASVVTITRPGSLSSQGTGKAGPMGSQSPSDTSLLALRINSSGQPFNRDDHKRRKSVAVDYADHGSNEGVGNLNRWSQSTNSSVSSNTRRSRASSGAVLPSLAHQQLTPRPARGAPDASPRRSPQRKRLSSREPSQRRLSPAPSPEREREWEFRKSHQRTDTRQKSLTALPQLHTTQSNTDTNDTDSPSTNPADTPATSYAPTPSVQSIYNPDYFGMREQLSPQSKTKVSSRPSVPRQRTAPLEDSQQPALPGAENVHHVRHGSRNSTHLDSGSRPTAHTHESGHRRSKTRERSERDKKAMLSKALQKANTAVLLDNASNFEGALDAYTDACRLLQMVMDRSSGPDDKRKLEAIRVTYSNRIEELRQLEENQAAAAMGEEKGLPARPQSDDSLASPALASSFATDNRSSAIFQTASLARQAKRERANTRGSTSSQSRPSTRDGENTLVPQISYEQYEPDSFLNKTLAAVEDSSRQGFDVYHSPDENAARKNREDQNQYGIVRPQHIRLPPPDQNYLPAPLSPRRLPPEPPLTPPPPPPGQTAREAPSNDDTQTQQGAERDVAVNVEPTSNHAPISWLDTVDESGSSCSESESVHSMDADQGIRRKHLRRISRSSNPDFDAAFDAAVEAAYNEGYEPDLDGRRKRLTAIQHDRQGTEESVEFQNPMPVAAKNNPVQGKGFDAEAEEEERLLDEITQDYAQGFNFDLGIKSALPRQSDSSSYTRSTRSTWQSSQPSDRNTAATSLSTVGEESLSAQMSKKSAGTPSSGYTAIPEPLPLLESLPPALPPPTSALPRPPSLRERRASVASTGGDKRMSTVRARRLSGHTPKPLTIETAKAQSRKRASTFHNHNTSPFLDQEQGRDQPPPPPPAIDTKAIKATTPLVPTISDVQHEHILHSPPSLELRSQTSMLSIPNTMTTVDTTTEGARTSQDDAATDLPSGRPSLFRKNKSSVSLREQHLVLSSPEDSQPSAVTPLSSSFMTFGIGRKQSNDPLTSQRAHFQPWGSSFAAINTHSASGGYLFDTSLSSDMPKSPMSPRSPGPNHMPIGLEPCPESFLLRPFWLLRTIYQTLAHPRGGFITNQLFVPREVWQTHGVKLKAIDEKIANCDHLTAALGKLAVVDSNDADALAEELHVFESTMERIQGVLVKKLGGEVGVHSVQGMFRDAAAAAAAATASQSTDDVTGATASAPSTSEKTTSKGKESKSFSWRKLRSKSSGAPLSGAGQTTSSGSGGAGAHSAQSAFASQRAAVDLPNMPSVPMTSFVPVERRGGKRDVRNLNFDGPNKEYMSSLARLFDGVQVLDQIARQVEDPGLKHSSPTHVGLELSIRHAAEFFGFFVCRFVLNDLGLLLDKFVKKGTEWVMV